MVNITFYWLPHCTTCQKALRFLESQNISVSQFRDLKKEPLSSNEVEDLSKMVGGPGQLFSRRAIKYRELKLSERELSEKEMLDLMLSDYTFLKRPILVVDDKAIAGFFEKTYKQFLADNYRN